MWFRKGLRIHDNPALEYASRGSTCVYPLFVIDPHYMEPDPNAFSPGSTRAGINRIRFLLESLADLDLSLKKLGSRLLVLKGEPSEALIRCLKEVIFSSLTYIFFCSAKTMEFFFNNIFFFVFCFLFHGVLAVECEQALL